MVRVFSPLRVAEWTPRWWRRVNQEISVRNIKLVIAYDGGGYCGWQVQAEDPKTRTIQGTMERVLNKVLGEDIRLIASGRTDSGVHAEAQAANFKTKSKLSPRDINRALNSLLPTDIVVIKAEEADSDFHARYNAEGKTYRYRILNSPTPIPFYRDYFYFVPYPLDIDLMRKEAEVLKGRHDFKSFQAAGSNIRKTVRTIKDISIEVSTKLFAASANKIKDAQKISLYIEADGFLYNMVRNIAGTLIEVARGRLEPGSVRKILSKKDRSEAGPTAPAKGLCLIEVKY